MKRINQSLFYELGKKLMIFIELDEDSEPFNIYIALMDVKAALNQVLGDNSIDLRYSRPEALDIIRSIDNVVIDFFQKEVDGKTTTNIPNRGEIPSWRLNFNHGVEKFETNLAAEFRESPTYYVPKRGAYETPIWLIMRDVF